jgi:hypothetical protein
MIFNRFNEPVKKDEPKMKISLLEALQGNMKKTATLTAKEAQITAYNFFFSVIEFFIISPS